jgi:HSP20 family protein
VTPQAKRLVNAYLRERRGLEIGSPDATLAQHLSKSFVMAETNHNVPVKTEKTPASPQARRPFPRFRREMDSLFEDFFGGRPHFRRPFLRRARPGFGAIPAVDLTETDKAYLIISQLPGEMDEKNVEVRFADGVLTIKGEKQEEREEKKKGYYMRERSCGSFERSFQVPEGIDANKIKARFKKGVLSVTLPKTPEARRAEKKLAVKAG